MNCCGVFGVEWMEISSVIPYLRLSVCITSKRSASLPPTTVYWATSNLNLCRARKACHTSDSVGMLQYVCSLVSIRAERLNLRSSQYMDLDLFSRQFGTLAMNLYLSLVRKSWWTNKHNFVAEYVELNWRKVVVFAWTWAGRIVIDNRIFVA